MPLGTESGLLTLIRRLFKGHPKKKVLPPENNQKYIEERLSRERIELDAKASEGFFTPVGSVEPKSPEALPNILFTVPASVEDKQPAAQKDHLDDLAFSVSAPLPKKEQKKQVCCAKEPLSAAKRPDSVMIPEEEKNLTEATIVINRRLRDIHSS